MSPPSPENRFIIGQRLYRIAGTPRTARLQTWIVRDLFHHYAHVQRISEGPDAGKMEQMDGRPGREAYLYTDARKAELDCAFYRHPLGGLANRIRESNATDALRCGQWKSLLGDLRPGPGPQTYAAALRLLCRHGLAERLPKPKRCPRYRLLAPPADATGGTPDLPLE